MAETDIAVSPLPDIESYKISFPAKLLEYMASGTVVIATNIQPHRQLIRDGETGYLYDETTVGLVSAFDRCFADREIHPLISKQAVEAAADYDWDEIVAQHEAVIFDK
jgi:glycosyltransferase involved in cell wall biosynthesis